MNANRSRVAGCATALALGLAGCVAAPPPPPATQPAPLPPAALPPPAPAASDWRDAPATPGVWSWSREGTASVASFADGVFVVRCERPGKPVTIARTASATGPVPMTVTTTSLVRPLTAEPLPGGALVGASLNPRDPLLDAMAFSRGRIAVDVAGTMPLYIPASPEMARVIEDCR